MNWHNLPTFTCPHCEKPLQRDEAAARIRCTVCTFTIDEERFEQIKKHRTGTKPTSAPRMRWQNLHKGLCPMSSHTLEQAPRSDLLECSDSRCTFKIREARANEILADPHHSANRFAGRP